MKLRWKILITILLATVTVWLQGYFERDHAVPGRCEGLSIWYKQYNEDYFLNELPKDTIVDYSEAGDFIATTSRLRDGRFHIAFNEKYAAAPRVAHIFLLHEQCHIFSWGETPDHGPRWRACMLAVDFQGANRAILIEGYTGQ